MNEQLVRWLFETKAVRVCPANQPFWYTSGKIGPYYVNTHFLYGSEEKANALLEMIDAAKEDRLSCSGLLEAAVMKNYHDDKIFRGTIDAMFDEITAHLPLDEISYISGGERRDWFFSLPIAKKLNLPHITIFKDMGAMLYHNGVSTPVPHLNGKKVLHIADLITTASSYVRAWVPAIREMGGEMAWSLVAVDRLQGGEEALRLQNVSSYALTTVGADTFKMAAEIGYVDAAQLSMVLDYINNDDESMTLFLRQHPDFLKNALNGNKKDAERARLCISENFYDVRNIV